MSDVMEASAMLSPHLSIVEFLATAHRDCLDEQANPPPLAIANGRRLALDIFEPARALVGPMHINSGWRCVRLNLAVGGSTQPPSAHLDGRAVDAVPLEMNIVDAFKRIAKSATPFDTLIFEHGRWIHMDIAKHGQPVRRRLRMKFAGGDEESWDPADPRVKAFKQPTKEKSCSERSSKCCTRIRS